MSTPTPRALALAPTLHHVRVRDAMHPGAFSCPADAPLADVVATMAHYRIHALVVLDPADRSSIAVVSDRDILAAAHGATGTAAQAAATEPVTIAADDRLDRAAHLMVERGVGHLIVLDSADGHAIGMLSSLDVAAVIAAGRGDE